MKLLYCLGAFGILFSAILFWWVIVIAFVTKPQSVPLPPTTKRYQLDSKNIEHIKHYSNQRSKVYFKNQKSIKSSIFEQRTMIPDLREISLPSIAKIFNKNLRRHVNTKHSKSNSEKKESDSQHVTTISGTGGPLDSQRSSEYNGETNKITPSVGGTNIITPSVGETNKITPSVGGTNKITPSDVSKKQKNKHY